MLNVPPEHNPAQQVRNITIAAHVDHGKTTLSDNLICAAGKLSAHKAGKACVLDVGEAAERGITIESTAITLRYEDLGLTVNLIDSPGHVEFNSQVTTALRITDGAVVVVDVLEGCCVQTETVLRQALAERLKPILVLNKADRLILELQFTADQIYAQCIKVIGEINTIIEQCQDPSLPCMQVSLEDGTVCIGSGYYGWMTNISTVADLYVSPSDDQTKRDAVLKKLSPGANFASNFSRLVLAPIMHLHQLVMRDAASPEAVNAALNKVGKKLERSDFSIVSNRDLLRVTMRNFMPAATTLLRMIMTKLPSPQEAQRYRTKVLYPLPTSRNEEGEDSETEITDAPPESSTVDQVFNAIQSCDPNGPCVMYVSKLVPIGKLLMALGRVFSGTVRPGMTVRVMAAENAHDPSAWTEARIQRVVQTEGHSISSLSEALAGSVCGLVGIDDCLTRSGTVTTSVNCRPLAAMNFTVSPVVRVAIRAENPTGASRLAHGLQVLIKNDPCIQCYMDSETKEHIVAGTGELHQEVCINRLRELCSGIPLVVSSALVSLRETVSGESPTACMAKSANKHNRVWFTASALPLKVVEDMEIAAASSIDHKTATLRVLERNGWSKAQQRKVMVCGGLEVGPNILVDSTTGVQYLQEIRDHIISAFTKLCLEGPLCRERLRGVRIDLVDARVHSEGAQRRAPQVVPACARAMSAAILSASPIVMEPMYCVEVQVPNNLVGTVHSVISRRRGTVESYSERAGDACVVHGFLPVSESNGFTADVRSQTHGKGFPTCRFDHWRAVGEELGTRVISESRMRKGMPEQVPSVESLIDKV